MSRFQWILAFAVVVATFFLAARLFGARTELEIQLGQIEVAWLKVEQGLERRTGTLIRLRDVLEDPQRRETLSSIRAEVVGIVSGLQRLQAASTAGERVEAHARIERHLRDFRDVAMSAAPVRQDKELQRLLEESLAIENRIHQDRTEYNEAVLRYNVSLALFPGNLAANVFRLQRHELYLPTELRRVPERNAAEAGPRR